MSNDEQWMVEVRDLVKQYPKSAVNAVDGTTFSVRPGEIFALLGPNGAGKTTTIGILTTRIRPTGGVAKVGGIDVAKDPVAARRGLAVVSQRNNMERGVSIRQNLLFHAAYHGIPKKVREERATALLTQFGMIERADERIDLFSGGQMQRAMIARALMHAPDMLFLDEPSTGLDPAARLFLWDRLRELREAGVTMMLTTHDMDEAAALSDRVAIMDHGHLLALDTPTALTQSLPGSSTLEVAVTGGQESALADQLGQLEGVERVESVDTKGGPGGSNPVDGQKPQRYRLFLTGDAQALVGPVASLISAAGAQLADLRIGAASLEDVFISLTGRSLR